MLTVNGEAIADALTEREIEQLRPGYERFMTEAGQTPSPEQLREWCIENLIERTVVRQEAARRNEPVDAAEATRRYEQRKDALKDIPREQALAEIETELRCEQLLKRVQDEVPEPAEAEVAAFFEARRGEFRRPERIHARHLIRHAGQHDRTAAYVELLNARERLLKGGDFVAEATEHSDCPDNGGDLGWFARGQMVPRFEDVVFALPPGGLSDVFETEFGLHVAQVTAREPEQPMTLAETREGIARHLRAERQNTAVEHFADELVSRARIERPPASSA